MAFEPFFYNAICAGLDRCQGTVHRLSSETDDILLKASIDPLSSCHGLVSERMGKGHMRVDFFTACLCVKAHKRAQRWRRCKNLWFSLPGPHWPLCRTAAEFSIDQMWSGEHDPWLLMWLSEGEFWGLGRALLNQTTTSGKMVGLRKQLQLIMKLWRCLLFTFSYYFKKSEYTRKVLVSNLNVKAAQLRFCNSGLRACLLSLC